MSDRRTHHGVAALIGLGVGIYVARNHEGWPVVARLLGAVAGSLLGGSLPDVLEPAVHSWHRRSFHSWAALAGSATVTVGPPAALRQWIEERGAAAERYRMQREGLLEGHADRAGLWLAEMFEHALIGATVGVPAGYASHLALDAGSPRGLPPL